MQIAAETATCQSLQSLLGAMFSEFSATVPQSQLSQYRAVRRNGVVVGFEPSKISVAVTKERLVRFRFDDGLEGSVFWATFSRFAGFAGGGMWRGFAGSQSTRSRRRWSGMDYGIRLDPEILYQDLLSGRPGNRFGSVGLAPSAE